MQIFDTHPGWSQIHKRITQPIDSHHQDRLISPFWKNLAGEYQNIKIYPLSQSQMQPNWGTFSKYAADNHLGTNAVYLARIDPNKINVSNKKFESDLANSSFSNNDFIIISDAAQLKVASAIEMTGATFFKLDGFNVFSPKNLGSSIPATATIITIGELLPKVHPEEVIGFTNTKNTGNHLLGKGWSHPENWGTWSEEISASIFIPTPNTSFIKIGLQIQPFLPTKNYQQTLEFKVGNRTLKKIMLDSPENQWIELEIPANKSGLSYTKLDIEIPNAVSPSTFQKSLDIRKLGVGIISLKFLQ